jgi:hypothetical protein
MALFGVFAEVLGEILVRVVLLSRATGVFAELPL